MKRTKNNRLVMIVREYERRHPGPFTMRAVASWGLSVGLLPAPGRTSAEADVAAEWEHRYQEIAAERLPHADEVLDM